MSKKFILGLVIGLGLLIIIAFLTLIYGMYLKISTKDNNFPKSEINFSANLKDSERIKNIEVLGKNKILILIENNDLLRGAIYDTEKNEFIRFIDK